eukprot:4246790-Prymnesium_polylepis.1
MRVRGRSALFRLRRRAGKQRGCSGDSGGTRLVRDERVGELVVRRERRRLQLPLHHKCRVLWHARRLARLDERAEHALLVGLDHDGVEHVGRRREGEREVLDRALEPAVAARRPSGRWVCAGESPQADRGRKVCVRVWVVWSGGGRPGARSEGRAAREKTEQQTVARHLSTVATARRHGACVLAYAHTSCGQSRSCQHSSGRGAGRAASRASPPCRPAEAPGRGGAAQRSSTWRAGRPS